MEIKLRQPYSFCQLGKRDNQEDARFPDSNKPSATKPVFIVCDGVGGLDKGEVASRTVADAMGQYMSEVDLSREFESGQFVKVLDRAYDRLEKAMSKETRDMATTMTFIAFHKGGVFCAHMGDSRIYHVRPGVGIMYQSDDHSLVNDLVHSGNLTPEEAIDHPQSNLITRCLSYVDSGYERPSAATFQIRDVEAGDYFFLCSDGVLHRVSDEELFDILSSDKSDLEKISQLAEMSKNSSDNNTAYLIGVHEVTGNEKPFAEEDDEDDEEETISRNTVKLENRGERVEEITSEARRGGKVSKFFKSLFG